MVQRQQRSREQLPFWKRLKISELGIRIVLGVFVVVGGSVYLFLANGVATRGLQLKDLSDRLESLQQQRSVLQAEVDRLQSMQRLNTVVGQLNLVRVSKVDYLTPPAGPVAAR